MIGEIVRKEILGNIVSLRFVLALLLIVSIFITSGVAFVNKYRQEVEDYRSETNKNFSALSERAKKLSKLASYKQTIWRKPKVLELCAEGFEKSLPNRFKVNVFRVDYPEVKSRANFMLPRFSDVDWVFIVSFILSFVALLLTYDSLSGEKETGTLRLMMSNSVPRAKVLLAKYLAAMLTLGIPLFLGLLINLIIVNTSGLISISGGQWLKVLAIIMVSIFYLSIFVLLGMFVSSSTARSSSSMVILLLLWVGLVVLIPSFGRIVSDKFHKIPNRAEVDRRIAEAQAQIWENRDKYGKNAGNWGGNLDADWVNPPARARLKNAITDSRNQIFEGYVNQMMAQVSTGRRFTRISPTVLYQGASEAIVGTGIARFWHLYQQIKSYQGILKQYVLSKDQEDPESRHLLFEGEGQRCMSQKPVDFNTVPQFEERNLPPGESLQRAILDIGLLLLFNVAFFMGAFVSFLRYDVR